MQLMTIQRILGILLSLFSITMLPPVLVSWWFNDGAATAFLTAFVILVSTGLLLWLPARKHRKELKIRDGFIVVVMFWIALGFFRGITVLSDRITRDEYYRCGV